MFKLLLKCFLYYLYRVLFSQILLPLLDRVTKKSKLNELKLVKFNHYTLLPKKFIVLLSIKDILSSSSISFKKCENFPEKPSSVSKWNTIHSELPWKSQIVKIIRNEPNVIKDNYPQKPNDQRQTYPWPNTHKTKRNRNNKKLISQPLSPLDQFSDNKHINYFLSGDWAACGTPYHYSPKVFLRLCLCVVALHSGCPFFPFLLLFPSFQFRKLFSGLSWCFCNCYSLCSVV